MGEAEKKLSTAIVTWHNKEHGVKGKQPMRKKTLSDKAQAKGKMGSK